MTAPRVGRFVDYEKLVVTWLMSQELTAATRVPDVIPDGFVWVTGVGGPSDYDIATPRVDVHSFWRGGQGAAMPTAKDVHEAMAALDGQTVAGQPVYTVYCPRLPSAQFWSADVDRVLATYELDLPVL